MKLKVGARLRSAVCSTEVIVVRAPSKDVELCCGGQPMLGPGETAAAAGSPGAGLDQGSDMGKRYVDEGLGIEVMVTKAGPGSLSVDGGLLDVQAPKKLPTSD